MDITKHKMSNMHSNLCPKEKIEYENVSMRIINLEWVNPFENESKAETTRTIPF